MSGSREAAHLTPHNASVGAPREPRGGTPAYYSLPAERLGQGARIPVRVLGTEGEVFLETALDMADTIASHNASGKGAVFIVPVGPVGQYPAFVRLVNERRLDLSLTWFINMDEYLDASGSPLDPSRALSFRGFMERTVYGRVDPELLMPERQRVFPDPRRPEALTELLDRLGGADVCYGGIGINGHVAFNEPEDLPREDFLRLPTRVVRLSAETRAINAAGELRGALEAMPEAGVTVGMREIRAARRIRLACFRDWHPGVVRRAAYGEPSARFPVSLLQGHPDIRITIPARVAEPPLPGSS